MTRLLLLLPLLLVAACGGGSTDVAAPAAQDELVVTYDAGDDAEPVTWTLACPGGGDHPQGEQACAHLATLEEPFAPVPADAVCTEQYGGPQTARVEGTWRGEQVALDLSRRNGCYISQWERLVPLVPAAE